MESKKLSAHPEGYPYRDLTSVDTPANSGGSSIHFIVTIVTRSSAHSLNRENRFTVCCARPPRVEMALARCWFQVSGGLRATLPKGAGGLGANGGCERRHPTPSLIKSAIVRHIFI